MQNEKNDNEEQLQIPDEDLPEGAELHSGRKQFVIHDFDTPHDKEMAVFTQAKKLSEYIFVITEKSPKKLRWSIISHLQNMSVEVIENLYRANCERGEARDEYQKRARVNLRLVDFYTQTARSMMAINNHHVEVIGRLLCETDKLLSGWIKSTHRKQTEKN
jgi:hypothetical protein